MDKISIIVPVLNSKEHLNRIIMGLLKQTINDMEIIIVDSGSSDSTLDMCKDWSFLDNRIKVYETKDSVIDFGLKKATGKYRQKHTEKEKDPQIPQVLSIFLQKPKPSGTFSDRMELTLLPSALHSPRGSQTLWPP